MSYQVLRCFDACIYRSIPLAPGSAPGTRSRTERPLGDLLSFMPSEPCPGGLAPSITKFTMRSSWTVLPAPGFPLLPPEPPHHLRHYLCPWAVHPARMTFDESRRLSDLEMTQIAEETGRVVPLRQNSMRQPSSRQHSIRLGLTEPRSIDIDIPDNAPPNFEVSTAGRAACPVQR